MRGLLLSASSRRRSSNSPTKARKCRGDEQAAELRVMEAAIGAIAGLAGALLGAAAAMVSSRREMRSALTVIETELRRERNATVEQGHLRE